MANIFKAEEIHLFYMVLVRLCVCLNKLGGQDRSQSQSEWKEMSIFLLHLWSFMDQIELICIGFSAIGQKSHYEKEQRIRYTQ